jgi:hypothetical protein
MNQRPDTVRSCCTPPRDVNMNSSTEEIHFKQLVVAPLSPHTQQFNSSVKQSFVERPVDTHNFDRHRRSKIKYRKPAVKVV